MKNLITALCFITLFVTGSLAQRKIEDGGLKGFTASPNEHIMNEIEEPFTVHSIEGVVVDSSGSPMPGVLVEIRGPGDEQTFHSAVTDSKGRYRIKHVKQGTYIFKTTLLSFQSEYGKIVVSKKTNPKARVDLKLQPGV